MSGHEAIGCDANLCLGVSLSEKFFKRGIVRRLLEQLESADTPIQDMIGEVPSSEARPAWHGGACIETSILLSRKDSRPLFSVTQHRTMKNDSLHELFLRSLLFFILSCR